MSIRAGILGVLLEQDAYGLQIHGELEERTSRVGRINVGQIYSTLDRLVTSGSVVPADPTDDGLPRYRITAAGREEFSRWLDSLDPDAASGWSDTVFMVLLVASLPSQDTSAAIDRAVAVWRGAADRDVTDLADHARSRLASAALDWLEVARIEAASLARPLSDLRPRRGRRPGPAPQRQRHQAGERAL
ncbi:PadR family transcriptional regulator [Cnuibacter sp. UC19_7]|uniref:PadR family transcriptional regulator n=1 Tax=Cnuibacter sp. UC19_7 TaxID=3350166 RepID=UPI00366F103E